MSRRAELVERLDGTDSFTDTMAAWLGTTHLVLEPRFVKDLHPLTPRERRILLPDPAVFYGYRRESFLRHPDGRPVAWVSATVLTPRLHRISPEATAAVIDGKRTLGRVLTELGAKRRTLAAYPDSRADYSGEPISVVTEAELTMPDRGPEGDDWPLALVREEVYEWAVESPAPTVVHR